MKRTIVGALIALLFVTAGGFLFGQSGLYDRIGIISEHGRFGAVPEENIDLFTGNLTLRFLDINLPGPNGLDLKIGRVYNSKILKDRFSSNTWGIQQEPYSWVGMGWSMHMGRVHNYNTNLPVIEFPDGRMETAYPATSEYPSNSFLTRDFLRYTNDNGNYKLYFKDGIVWTFGGNANLTYIGSLGQVVVETVLLVTRIENSYGHSINITYKQGLPVIDEITDSLSRKVTFITTGSSTYPKLDYIRLKNAAGVDVIYDYTVGAYTYGGYYQLTHFKSPEISWASYEYGSGQTNNYELSAVNTPYGGSMRYSYATHNFYCYLESLESRVVSQKRIQFTSSGSESVWNFAYPNYQNASTGTVTVSGPLFNTSVIYHAYSSAAPWKIGLMKEKTLSDGSYSEQYEYGSQVLSSWDWIVSLTNLGDATAPLLSKVKRIRKGEATDAEEYIYGITVYKKYGLPSQINSYCGTSETRKKYKTLTYYFITHSNSPFAAKYMLSYIDTEKDYENSGTLLKETQTNYYDIAGSCGAIDWIKRLKSSGNYLTWDYTYTSSNPNFITIGVNLPGTAGTEYYEYNYGVLSKIIRPGHTELSQTISSHDSSVLAETNQHGGTSSFTYDNLGRITNIALPSGFNPVSATWSTNSVSISQGGNTVVKSWDGMGRDLGFVESGDGISLYYRKVLDAEGRPISEIKGSTNSSDIYNYELNASGQITKITDPRGKITNIAYASNPNKKTVTDPNGHVSVYTYNDLPGLVTQVKDAENRYSDHTFDGLGRLTEAKYNNSRTQSYSYDQLGNVTSETHPETGTINYAFNAENNLQSRVWADSTINYAYNASNQILSQASSDETIDYSYDSQGRVRTVSGSKGWQRGSILYNSLGAVTREIISIPGLSGGKTISYDYNGNNILASITYPDGKVVSYTNNGLNAPETAAFNGKSLVNQISYGYNKQPTSISVSGNNTQYTASYNNAGLIASQGLNNSGGSVYNSGYTYDNVGNITRINQTTPVMSSDFGYDYLNRLTSATYTAGPITNYGFGYDEYGNLRTVGEMGGLVFNASIDPTNRISGFSYDSRGNQTSSAPRYYIWDKRNRLTQISNAGNLEGQFLYDERGLRLKAERLDSTPVALTVVSPNGGEYWVKGSVQNIQWTSQGIVGNVRLRYSIDGGLNYIEIASSTENDGLYQWTIPNVDSRNCLIEVAETAGTQKDTSNAPFSFVTSDKPWIYLDRTALNFGKNSSGVMTSTQTFRIYNNLSGPLVWTLTPSVPWIICTPSSGMNFGVVSVSINASGLSQGSYQGSIVVSDPWALNGPQTLTVRLDVYGGTAAPFGCFDSPSNGQECSGTIAVTGWALDDIEVQSIEIKRNPVGSETGGPDGLVFIGNGVFVDGARPDVAAAYPNLPFSSRGGWGYALLTLGLPNQGMNDWFTLHAIAFDKEGNRLEIGQRLIHCLNINSIPFGTIDTPGQGGLAFGASYYNWGWALTPQPDYIPYDGSSILVWVDGVPLGHPVYNLYREDIATLYPGYANSNGAVGYYVIDMMQYSNGLHTIAWSVTDSGGQAEGIGSRYFEVQNGMNFSPDTSGRSGPAKASDVSLPISYLVDYSNDWRDISVNTRYKVHGSKTRISSDEKGEHSVTMQELDQMEIELLPDENTEDIKKFEGFHQIGDRLFQLPVGSTFDPEKGIFYWMPGPAFLGEYDLVFLKEGKDKSKILKRIKVLIGRKPKDPKEIPSNMPVLPIIEESLLKGSQETTSYRPASPFPIVDEFSLKSLKETASNRPASPLMEEFSIKGPWVSEEFQMARPSSTTNKSAALVTTYVSTYYLYSFDGKLLAEYDNVGTCTKDYIYLGNRLLAEYKPATSAYYYYMSDQVNSVRMITNDSGNVVYSAAYGPYGKIQKEWVTTYKPELKFSGKERESGSEMDYFGARYYANTSFRWISPDPVIGRDEALFNPQLWNLYSYCRNNPIGFMDPDGQKDLNINVIRFYESKTATFGLLYVPEANIFGVTLELPWRNNTKYTSRILEGSYDAQVSRERWVEIENVKGREGIMMHPGKITKNSTGCILGGEIIDIEKETILGNWVSSRRIMEKITSAMNAEKKNDENSKFKVNIANISGPIINSIVNSIIKRPGGEK